MNKIKIESMYNDLQLNTSVTVVRSICLNISDQKFVFCCAIIQFVFVKFLNSGLCFYFDPSYT